MPDEITTSTSEQPNATAPASTGGAANETAPPADSAAPAASEAERQADGDWQKWLESAPAEDLRRHPRIAGIVGEMLQRREADWKRKSELEAADKAGQAERDRLRKLRREDPLAYAQEMDTREELEEAETKLARLRGETRDEYAKRIATAMQALPEWKEVSRDDLVTLGQAMAGKKDDEALEAFVTAALGIVSPKAAKRMFEEWKTKEMDTALKAARQEWEAERLAASDAPDMTKGRPKAAGNFDPTKLKGKAFDDWYEKHILRR